MDTQPLNRNIRHPDSATHNYPLTALALATYSLPHPHHRNHERNQAAKVWRQTCTIEVQLLTGHRKYPQFDQNEIFQLSNAFQNLDVDDKGYLDEATVIKATQNSERQPYDVVRQALKEVELDSSRRVELDDYVDVFRPTRSSSRHR